MANTYTQIPIQYVFAVKFRAALIDPNWKSELHQFISGLLKSRDHKPLQINCMPDHIPIFLGQRPDDSIRMYPKGLGILLTRRLIIRSKIFQTNTGSFLKSSESGLMIIMYSLNFKPSPNVLRKTYNVQPNQSSAGAKT